MATEKKFTNVRIQHRTKTSAEWLAFTEAPLKGELCVELNVNEADSAISTKIKIGDGQTLFKDLAYVGGSDGTSVTVSNVSESTEDGGNNVVTFSDGKTLTVKNGSKGSQGEKGDQGIQGEKGDKGDQGTNGKDGTNGTNGKDGVDGYTPVKGKDYFTETDKAEIVSSVIATLPVYDGSVTVV